MRKILLVLAILLLNGVGYCESQDAQLTTQNSAMDKATIASWGNHAEFFIKNNLATKKRLDENHPPTPPTR